MNKETDSIVRYCKPTQMQDNQVCASAFFLRKKNIDLKRPEDEKELSVHQFEFFPNDSLKNLKEYLQNNNFNLKPEGCFAKIKYSELEKDIKNFLFLDIDIKQDISSPHCLIFNLYQHDEDAAYYFIKNIENFTKIKDIGTS